MRFAKAQARIQSDVFGEQRVCVKANQGKALASRFRFSEGDEPSANAGALELGFDRHVLNQEMAVSRNEFQHGGQTLFAIDYP